VQIQEVLCAASGSERPPRTAEYARCLAEGARAHLTLLHVKRPRDASSEILELAKKRGADLIVIGNHDRRLGTLDYLGSTSDDVVREAGCGVLTVRATPWPRRRESSSRERAFAGTSPA
jgi:nucleotide-binding universal stress UspA family protein